MSGTITHAGTAIVALDTAGIIEGVGIGVLYALVVLTLVEVITTLRRVRRRWRI